MKVKQFSISTAADSSGLFPSYFLPESISLVKQAAQIQETCLFAWEQMDLTCSVWTAESEVKIPKEEKHHFLCYSMKKNKLELFSRVFWFARFDRDVWNWETVDRFETDPLYVRAFVCVCKKQEMFLDLDLESCFPVQWSPKRKKETHPPGPVHMVWRCCCFCLQNKAKPNNVHHANQPEYHLKLTGDACFVWNDIQYTGKQMSLKPTLTSSWAKRMFLCQADILGDMNQRPKIWTNWSWEIAPLLFMALHCTPIIFTVQIWTVPNCSCHGVEIYTMPTPHARHLSKGGSVQKGHYSFGAWLKINSETKAVKLTIADHSVGRKPVYIQLRGFCMNSL